MAHDHDEQVNHLIERYKAVGVDRRTVLKMVAAAGIAGAPAMRQSRFASAQDGTPAADAGALGPDDVFYSYELVSDPVSFDWNLNLYCAAETEVNASLLTFDADLNAIPDWAETFTPNEDASVWTFNIRQNNKGWTDGTPVTAQDFVFSWARQLAPENGAAYAGFLFDIKNAEKFNTSTANPDGTHTDVDGNPVFLATNRYNLQVTMERWPKVGFHATREHGQRLD